MFKKRCFKKKTNCFVTHLIFVCLYPGRDRDICPVTQENTSSLKFGLYLPKETLKVCFYKNQFCLFVPNHWYHIHNLSVIHPFDLILLRTCLKINAPASFLITTVWKELIKYHGQI